jgi:ketol-acid reductoisomerase
MREVLADITNGSFAQRFIDDQDNGAKEFNAFREKAAAHPIEKVGKDLREMMAWVRSSDDDYIEGSSARS